MQRRLKVMLATTAALLIVGATVLFFKVLPQLAETQIGDPGGLGREVLKNQQQSDGPARTP